MNDTTQIHWTIDPMHTTIGFRVRHLLITNVHGVFETMRGSVRAREDLRGPIEVDVQIDAASVNTRVPQRDEHLRSPDFFAAADHPQWTFRAAQALGDGGANRTLTGVLTLRGVTRDVTLQLNEVTAPSKDMNGKWRRGVSATTTIQRSAFGISFNKVLEAGGMAIADDVFVSLDLSLLKVEGV